MSLRRAFHEIFANGLYEERERYVQITPFEQFGPKERKASMNMKLTKAKLWLGERWCLRNPSPPKPPKES